MSLVGGVWESAFSPCSSPSARPRRDRVRGRCVRARGHDDRLLLAGRRADRRDHGGIAHASAAKQLSVIAQAGSAPYDLARRRLRRERRRAGVPAHAQRVAVTPMRFATAGGNDKIDASDAASPSTAVSPPSSGRPPATTRSSAARSATTRLAGPGADRLSGGGGDRCAARRRGRRRVPRVRRRRHPDRRAGRRSARPFRVGRRRDHGLARRRARRPLVAEHRRREPDRDARTTT